MDSSWDAVVTTRPACRTCGRPATHRLPSPADGRPEVFCEAHALTFYADNAPYTTKPTLLPEPVDELIRRVIREELRRGQE